MSTPLVVVGCGGFGREVAEAVRAVNARHRRWQLLGFLDDDPAREGTKVDGTPVLGPIDLARTNPGWAVVVSVGNPTCWWARKRIVDRLALTPERYATVVHPSASVASTAVIGPGSVLLAGAVVTAAARIGSHVAVMPQVVITHDDVVADQVTLATGVRLAGGVVVAQGAYVGAGVLVREHVRIGAWSMIGMGAGVVADVPPGEVWAGLPARRLRAAGVPDELLAVASAA